MQRIRIRKVIELHGSCYLIDPSRNGMEINGQRVECEDPQSGFDQMKAKVIAEVEADLDAWKAELFPPETEQPEEPEEPETEEETTTEEEDDEEA